VATQEKVFWYALVWDFFGIHFWQRDLHHASCA